MKAKLLKKSRRKVRIIERNGFYAIQVYLGAHFGWCRMTKYIKSKNKVRNRYRLSVLNEARSIFGKPHKNIIS